MNVALTGATGFLGRRFAARAGPELRITALSRPGRAPVPGVARTIEGTLEDAAATRAVLEGADALVFLAATGVQSRDRDWNQMLRVNAVAPPAWARAAADASVARVVAAGTCVEYAGGKELAESASTETADGYGATKAAGGLALRASCRAAGLPCWYLRFASLYGPEDDGDKLVPSAVRAALAGERFAMGPGTAVREWLHVDDAVDALLAALRAPAPGADVINVGTGQGVTQHELVQQIFLAAGADPSRIDRGARPGRSGEPAELVMNVAAARSRLGWQAKTPLAEGLARLAGGRP